MVYHNARLQCSVCAAISEVEYSFGIEELAFELDSPAEIDSSFDYSVELVGKLEWNSEDFEVETEWNAKEQEVNLEVLLQ